MMDPGHDTDRWERPLRIDVFVRLSIAGILALVLGGTVLTGPARSAPNTTSPTAARAGGCNVPHCWMAVSFNTATGYSGWTSGRGRSTKAAAMRAALESCRTRPENAGRRQACVGPAKRNSVIQNGCVAVFFRRRNGRIVEWAKGLADTPTPAKRKAKRIVNDGPGVVVLSRVDCSARKL